ncbi:non-ribosomal peptide synthetase [Vibrio vulnificus]|uniref:non-ribosomal peptide synthetase n=1 Tax=Vibrio vulnificus TaxID=672 RepID=UPI00165D5B30|nr:non-ribosomal peptide synthetase [Vibrio vulnificus]
MMMKLINKLAQGGIAVWCAGDNLQVAAKKNSSGELIAELKTNKAELLEYLQGYEVFRKEDFLELVSEDSNPSKLEKGNKIVAILPANSLQQGFISHHLQHPNDDAYCVQLLTDHYYALDMAAYQEAWRLASLRHPVLRTAFNWDEQILQIVTAESSISVNNFRLVDLSGLSKAEREVRIGVEQKKDRQVAFDLTQPGLVRFTLFKHHERHYTVLKTEHHAIADGWSGPELMATVEGYYQQLMQGEVPLVEVDNSYLDAQRYVSGRLAADQAYWKEEKARFKGGNDIRPLLDRTVSPEELRVVRDPGTQVLTIEDSDYQALKAFCQMNSITLNVALQFVWHKLLQVYTQSTQTIVGTTVSGRDIPVDGVESSVGLFINTLPLALDWVDDCSISEQLTVLQQQVAALNSHSAVSLAELQSQGERLFHSLFVFENYPLPINKEVSEQAVTFRGAVEKTDYPLNITVYEQNETLIVRLGHDRRSLTDEGARRLLKQLRKLLQQIQTQPDVSHQQLELICEEDKQQLREWNRSAAQYPQDKSLVQLFEAQAAKTPDAVALVVEGERLTYGELNAQANQLARAIRSQYLATQGHELLPDTLIALYFERSLEMVVSILAVLKAGGAYVPMSPEAPDVRLAHILEDTQAPMVLTQAAQVSTLEPVLNVLACAPLLLPVDIDTVLRELESDNLVAMSGPQDLAYVIYTSGSTGNPKGVLNTHNNAVRLFRSTDADFSFGCDDTWVLFHSYTFDFSVWELWGALLHGGRLIVPTEAQRKDAEVFTSLLAEQRVTVLNQTPTAFNALTPYAVPQLDKLSLRSVVFGGEALKFSDLKPWFEAGAGESVAFINMYGITETTVHVTYKAINASELDLPSSNIGRPINDLRAYVLSPQQQLLPVGTPGELYIGGAGVARGYLNRPELTEERFIANPFASEEDKRNGYDRLYRSGDLVRWLSDGNLEYLGRNDFQVKIRGYRVELGEIETALTAQPDVQQAVVIDRVRKGDNSGDKYLAAYLVGADGQVLDVDVVRDILCTQLPGYMVPGTFTVLDAIPLTVNGKVDRRALPEPVLTNQANYVAPSTETEHKLCAILAEVQGLASDEISVSANFFELGGDSIRAIRVVAKAKHAGLSLAVKDLLSRQTITALAQAIDADQLCAETLQELAPFALLNQSEKAALADVITTRQVVDAYPLTQLQQGMIYHNQLDVAKGIYHDIFSYQVQQAWDPAYFSAALNALVSEHEILRTTVQLDGERLLQLVRARVTPRLEIEDLRGQTPAAQQQHVADWLAHEKQQPFDLEQPLWSVMVHLMGDNDWVYTLNFHHAILDGWSVASLNTELFNRYQAALNGQPWSRAEAPLPFKHYVALELQAIQSSEAQQYWREQLADTSQPWWSGTTRQHALHRDMTFSATVSEKLPALAKQLGVQERTVLLAAHMRLIALLSGRCKVVSSMVSNGRPEHTGGERTLGLFLNSLPLCLDTHDLNWVGLIQAVEAKVIASADHRRFPLAAIQQLAGQDLSVSMFNYVHFHVYNEAAEQTQLSLFNGFEETNVLLGLSFSKDPSSGQFGLHLSAEESAFSSEFVDRIMGYCEQILETMLSSPQAPIASGPGDLLSVDERHTLLAEWNDTEAPYPQDKTLAQLFEDQVEKEPGAVALVFEDEQLTYAELNARANQLARAIRSQYRVIYGHELLPDTLIALYQERSVEMVVSILAVLKAGGAYVPISSEAPAARIIHMLQDTQVPLVLTQLSLVQSMVVFTQELNIAPQLLCVDSETGLSDLASSNLPPHSGPQDLAYVIYTSGSTGVPKGVACEHQGVVNVVTHDAIQVGVDSTASVLHSLAFNFDASGLPLWMSLTHGACLILSPDITLTSLVSQQAEQVTHLITTPGVLKLLSPDTFPRLRAIELGGESCPHALARQWGKYTDVYIVYGPTEATIQSATCRFDETEAAVRIGSAVSNTQLFVLGEQQQLLPIGVPGELYIAGAGVARGYLNRPGLTAERFIANPYATKTDKTNGFDRLYRTGDLVRFLPDGNLEYLGRNDCQVKIRGFRIELGEIESALTALDWVQQALVIDCEHDGNKFLAAYLVTSHGQTFDTDVVRSSLSTALPDYMVPATFTMLEAIPLTSNGKVDRRALPEPELVAQVEYVAPQDELEVLLCRIWMEVLGLELVGVTDNFFRIGGDSIQSVKVVSRLSQCGYDMTTRQLMQNPTVAELALVIERTEEVTEAEVNTGVFALLPGQRALLTDSLDVMQLRGQAQWLSVPKTFSVDVLTVLLQAWLKRHDALRMAFEEINGTWQGVYRDMASCDSAVFIERHDLSDEQHAEQEVRLQAHQARLQTAFDLNHPPLIKLAHFKLGHGVQRVLLVVHPLVADSASWQILLAEWQQALVSWSEQGDVALEPLTSSCQAWSKALHSDLRSESLSAERHYWQNQVSTSLQLVPDWLTETSVYTARRRMSLTVAADTTLLLFREGLQAYRISENELLMAALLLAYRKWQGSEGLCVALPAGSVVGDDVRRTVGCYTTPFPLILQVGLEADLNELITAVKAAYRGVPHGGEGYGKLRYLTSEVPFPAGRAPVLFQGIAPHGQKAAPHEVWGGLWSYRERFVVTVCVYRLTTSQHSYRSIR